MLRQGKRSNGGKVFVFSIPAFGYSQAGMAHPTRLARTQALEEANRGISSSSTSPTARHVHRRPEFGGGVAPSSAPTEGGPGSPRNVGAETKDRQSSPTGGQVAGAHGGQGGGQSVGGLAGGRTGGLADVTGGGTGTFADVKGGHVGNLSDITGGKTGGFKDIGL